MRILLTGATGFIGRSIITQLGERHEIVAVSRSAIGPDTPDAADWIVLDLAQPLDVRKLPEHVDVIVHLAQSERYKEFPEGAQDVYAVGLHCTFSLLEWGRRVGAQTFVLASTGGVYARSARPLREGDPVELGSLYFATKYAAEVLVGTYADLLRPVVVRPFFPYGETQQRHLIPRLAQKIVRGEEIAIAGDPGMRINPIHVEDAVRAIESLLVGSVSGVVNLAGSDTLAVGELVALLGEALGVEPAVRHEAADRSGDLVGATERLREELGVAPHVRIKQGIGRFVAGLARA